MKELIEDYKSKMSRIKNYLDQNNNSEGYKIRLTTKYECYRTFITELEAIEKEAKQTEDFTLFDLSGIPAQEKDVLINDFSILTSTNALKVYKSLGLKVGFETKMHNDPTDEDFILSFKKLEKEATK